MYGRLTKISVQMCYRITDSIKSQKFNYPLHFQLLSQCWFMSIGCFELLKYIYILYINALLHNTLSKIVSENDQEIPQLQTADNPMAPQGRATQPSRDTRETN